ncbi:inositol polyphosphate-5-phosphatase A-like isoform X2 [Apostichopus japonicus]|uniref:inositol polyphosphate-5-phosphatase A-like isoform X2 n=2 Tax=Stichopus japonicus TaxID=307972 RepID=UPI003AB40369
MMEPGVLLITANLGTLFEKPQEMLEVWMSKLYETIEKFNPSFIALHCQEVGGKKFKKCMKEVSSFVSHLMRSSSMEQYDRAAMYLDEDFTLDNHFTALGNIYFVHNSVKNIQCFDFKDSQYRTLSGKNIHQGNLLGVSTHVKERFPPHYFPEVKWSRKGYLRTRWKLENITFDLVNVHLFHDASNVQAMEKSPSLFSNRRKQALESILENFSKDKHEKAPFFIFGDFNFRLDAHSLINTLVGKAKPEYTRVDGAITRVVYTENGGESQVILNLEVKKFEPLDEEKFNCNDALWLMQYDKELECFRKKLFEFERHFPPSYPYSEAIENGSKYMKTRVPAWCDRIFLSLPAKTILSEDPTKVPTYDVIGEDVCMGDHKPVFLHFHLKVAPSNVTPRNVVTSNTNRNKRVIIYRETSV